jgi:hypothetical protein
MSDYDHLVPFLKYLDMAKRHGWPIIAHERYFEALNSLEEHGFPEASLSAIQNQWSLEQHPSEGLDRIKAYPIPALFEKKLISNFPSQLDAWVHLLTHSDENFTRWIEKTLDDIATNHAEQIEGILCFFVPESLRVAADARKIRIFSNEQGAARPPFYKTLTAYIDSNAYSEGELSQRFARFIRGGAKVPMLSRKGLLRLFAAEEYLKDIHQIDAEPQYELGILLLHAQYACTTKIRSWATRN